MTTSSNLPFVSVIVPCRNEEKFIDGCLKSLAEEQSYPKDRLEILVVDGMSEDNTKIIVEEYAKNHAGISVRRLENKNKFTPFAMNIGIKEAKGEIIVRADAHTQYPPEYINYCVFYLVNGYKAKETNSIEEVDNVGGIVVVPTLQEISTIIKDDKIAQIKARAIAISISHPFGAASTFRLGSKEPVFVDTVFGGCYRKKIFYEIGFFNENLKRSQDLEFNLRLVRAGKKILLDPRIKFRYYSKLNFREFFLHNFEDGVWAIYPLKFIKKPFKLRHYIPFIFVVSLTGSVILSFFSKIFLIPFGLIIFSYLFLNFYFSFKIAEEEKNNRFRLLIFRAFICRHFGYGLGSFWGLIKIIMPQFLFK